MQTKQNGINVGTYDLVTSFKKDVSKEKYFL